MRAGDHIKTSRRVLVADDSESGRMLVVEVLKHHRFIVYQAATAGELTHLLSYAAFDAVVLNLTMPPNSGSAYVSKVRSMIPQRSQLVVYSVLSRDDVEASVKRAGADHFFQIPIRFSALVPLLEADNHRGVGDGT